MKIALLITTWVLTAAAAVAQPAPATFVTVVSLNLARATDAQAIVREIHERPLLRDADIFLFQEVAQPDAGRPSVAQEAAAIMKMHVAYAPAKPGVFDQGLAIVSRYDIAEHSVRALKPYNLRFRTRSRIALSATVRTPSGPLRIANAHLDTRLNAEDRLDQLEPVIRECEEFRGPQIVGGDFNSNDFYWLGRVLPLPRPQSQSRAVHNLMTKRGFRTPVPMEQPTFDYLGMKLDWIYAAGLDSRDAEIYPLQFSDHHAVWARFSFGSDPGTRSPQLP